MNQNAFVILFNFSAHLIDIYLRTEENLKVIFYSREKYGDLEVNVEVTKKENRSRPLHKMLLKEFINKYHSEDIYMVHHISGNMKGTYNQFFLFCHTCLGTWSKNYWAACESLGFLKPNVYVGENFKFQCDPFSNKKDVSQRSSCRQLLSEMAYIIFGYFLTKLGTSVDGHVM
jgi:hypothetical protein